MILRPRRRGVSFCSIGKLTLDLCTQAIDEIRAKQPEAVKSVADLWFICALAERDAAIGRNGSYGIGRRRHLATTKRS